MASGAVKTEPTREQWMLARTWVGAVHANNAPFCSDGGPAEIEADPDYVDNVARLIAVDCGAMQLEDAIQVLDRALELREALIAGDPAGPDFDYGGEA